MKKYVAILLAAVMTMSLVACGSSDSSSDEETAEETTEEVAEEEEEAEEAEEEAVEEEAAEEEAEEVAEEAEAAGVDGEVSVFYYTYGDTYISSVRAALDAEWEARGVSYQDYDSNNSQTTQTEQVQTALAKGTALLIVNLVDAGSDDAAQNIIDLASAQSVPVIFFNRSVEESVVTTYDDAVFVGTDYEMAGIMQGEMIGEYLVENYDAVDLNGDGVISYVMLKGQEGNLEAIARTEYSVQYADEALTEAGYPELEFYDASNDDKYLVDQDGAWSAAAASNYMQTILSQYSESNGNMVELVIANNDEMAIGAITALQNAGYNQDGATVIPVFGVDATDAAKEEIANGTMIGTIKQDAEGMAEAIAQITVNLATGADKFDGCDEDNVVGTWRINIPYAAYLGE